jgi:hypothetical protein
VITDELEALSDKVRRGDPIGFHEALAVVEYQTALRAARDRQGFWRTLFRKMTSLGESVNE